MLHWLYPSTEMSETIKNTVLYFKQVEASGIPLMEMQTQAVNGTSCQQALRQLQHPPAVPVEAPHWDAQLIGLGLRSLTNAYEDKAATSVYP